MADVASIIGPIIGPRCLVTGGCGYLGRALVAQLLELGCEVHTVDLAEAAPDPRVRHFRGDLRHYASIAPAFEGVQTVFHSAALIATVEERFAQPALRRMAYAVNVVGTENVLRAPPAARRQTEPQLGRGHSHDERYRDPRDADPRLQGQG